MEIGMFSGLALAMPNFCWIVQIYKYYERKNPDHDSSNSMPKRDAVNQCFLERTWLQYVKWTSKLSYFDWW